MLDAASKDELEVSVCACSCAHCDEGTSGPQGQTDLPEGCCRVLALNSRARARLPAFWFCYLASCLTSLCLSDL